jgi:DNA-binding NarL/FixJ family response regulator
MANILLIEDYASLQKIYSAILENEGHVVHVASDGNQGLDLAKKYTVDLILLDMLMPNAGGIKFLEAYNLKSHPAVKLIILSNVFSTKLLNQALELGASNYLVKADITPQTMAKIVDETLASRADT